jgi:flagellar motility protein MotE (MotC chaperone)
MIRLARELRLIPVVLIATMCLFALKTLGLLLDGGYVIALPGFDARRPAMHAATPTPRVVALAAPAAPPERPPSAVQGSDTPDIFNLYDVTGSVTAPKPAEKEAAKPPAKVPAEPKPVPDGTPVDTGPPTSAAERAILERLQQRRQELDTRARELDIRESLLKNTEKRIETQLSELKEVEARITTATQQKDEAEAARFKGLVTMYENMKAKDAAKIFDRLDMKVLLDVSTQINPRRMSDILALMSPEAAERLTVELASRASTVKAEPAMELPKIEGRRSGT